MDISEPVDYSSCEMKVYNTVCDPVFCARSNIGFSADVDVPCARMNNVGSPETWT